MRLTSIGSGSSGNALLVQSGETAVLFDAGVGIRRIRNVLIEADVASQLSGVIISHEHGDHVRSLKSLCRQERCSIFASVGTFQEIGRPELGVEVSAHRSFTVGELSVTPVPVSHDAREPYGFVVESPDETLALFTDLGVASADVADALSTASLVIIESNYCDLMLADSHYPPVIKRRISSPRGHLSNDDCAGLVHASIGPMARSIWLAHLSENNNLPEIAESTTSTALSGRAAQVSVAALPRTRAVLLSAS